MLISIQQLSAGLLTIEGMIAYGCYILPGSYYPGPGCFFGIEEKQGISRRLAAPVCFFRCLHAGSAGRIIYAPVHYRAELRNSIGVFEDYIVDCIWKAGRCHPVHYNIADGYLPDIRLSLSLGMNYSGQPVYIVPVPFGE